MGRMVTDMKVLLYIFLFLLAIEMLPFLWWLYLLFAVWKIYEFVYFRSQKFLGIKQRIQSYVDECNALNQHIEELKDTSLEVNRVDQGRAEFRDESKWNLKRKELKNQKYAPHIYNCSKSVCGSARNKPFDYVCKYFGVTANEESLEKFETILNNFEAAEEGKKVLDNERKSILDSIKSEVPLLIKKLSSNKLYQKLGFEPIDFSTIYFPKYTFRYVSPGGNVGDCCDIVMDIENLNKFVVYLSEKIKFKKSVAGQRALMTSKLRQTIKERDGYTCKMCGISVEQEPNLLLEIDHIIPVSKGGLTTEDNLQTLCWKCNRSKGAKI